MAELTDSKIFDSLGDISDYDEETIEQANGFCGAHEDYTDYSPEAVAYLERSVAGNYGHHFEKLGWALMIEISEKRADDPERNLLRAADLFMRHYIRYRDSTEVSIAGNYPSIPAACQNLVERHPAEAVVWLKGKYGNVENYPGCILKIIADVVDDELRGKIHET